MPRRHGFGWSSRSACCHSSTNVDPEHSELIGKTRDGTATDEQRRRFGELHQDRSREILAATEEELYEVREVQ